MKMKVLSGFILLLTVLPAQAGEKLNVCVSSNWTLCKDDTGNAFVCEAFTTPEKPATIEIGDNHQGAFFTDVSYRGVKYSVAITINSLGGGTSWEMWVVSLLTGSNDWRGARVTTASWANLNQLSILGEAKRGISDSLRANINVGPCSAAVSLDS